MKKIYLSPDTQVIKIKICKIMTASNPTVAIDPDEAVNANEVESRRNRYDIWEEEELEDDYY
jgi:hypothetical protein